MLNHWMRLIQFIYDLRPVFTSRKIIDDIKGEEAKPPLSN